MPQSDGFMLPTCLFPWLPLLWRTPRGGVCFYFILFFCPLPDSSSTAELLMGAGPKRGGGASPYASACFISTECLHTPGRIQISSERGNLSERFVSPPAFPLALLQLVCSLDRSGGRFYPSSYTPERQRRTSPGASKFLGFSLYRTETGGGVKKKKGRKSTY